MSMITSQLSLDQLQGFVYQQWHLQFHGDELLCCHYASCKAHRLEFQMMSFREWTEIIVAGNAAEGDLYKKTCFPKAKVITTPSQLIGLRINVLYVCGSFAMRADAEEFYTSIQPFMVVNALVIKRIEP